ncbi:quinone oxidoreductase [Rarobacter faecitabidus]|uniref:NADPH2:quinone reductase n=1 Tax=Rarobacter faecitabidus TaxID=13243 RepID=A0A542ZW51_RARFA|nr:quinone oxidoreductase [Rarobacter faecitabidus]TQL64587.1 NADPH2:quinone reductase [Rarobacter faecitabidus]
MRAMQVARTGGPEALVPVDAPTPAAGPGEVLVRVAYAGVNFIDVYRRTGLYQVELPAIAGVEGAGIIEAVGAGVDEVQVGDRVAWVDAAGSYAQFAVLRAERAIPVPAGISLRAAAAVALQGLTAHFLATSTFPLAAGDDVLIHAGAGGVGLLLTQMADLHGARVITTTSTQEKAELSRQAGASNTLNYTAFDDLATELPRAVKALTGGRGVTVVYDGVGRATFDGSLASLRPRGMLVAFGAASGPIEPFDIQRLNAGGSLYLTRPSLWHYVASRDELLRRSRELFAWIKGGDVTVRIGAQFALDEAPAAHELLESRGSTGKIVLAVNPSVEPE